MTVQRRDSSSAIVVVSANQMVDCLLHIALQRGRRLQRVRIRQDLRCREGGERLFVNQRTGSVALEVDITFDADLDSRAQSFVGHATVTIRNLEPEHFPGGVILPVTVFETRVVDKYGRTEEFIADRMTIHLVPSFLVLGQEYFADRREGMQAINTIFGEINDRYAISEQRLVPVGPEWQVRRRAVEEAVKIEAIQQFARAEPELAEHTLQRFRTPAVRGGSLWVQDSIVWRIAVLALRLKPSRRPGQSATSRRTTKRVTFG